MRYEILPPSGAVLDQLENQILSGMNLEGLPDISSECHILDIQPRESSDNWPYASYPDLLPYVPLRLAERVRCSPEDFQGLILHGDEVSANEVTVVVPPMFDLGISLFGHDADAEGLQLVFRCDLENKKLTIRV